MSKLRVSIDSNSFPTFQLPTFLSKMSSSTVSVEMIQQLQASVDAMRADVTTLNARLAEALGQQQAPAAEPKAKKAKGDAAPVAEGQAAEPKKRGRKPKAAAPADEAPAAGGRPAAGADGRQGEGAGDLARAPRITPKQEWVRRLPRED